MTSSSMVVLTALFAMSLEHIYHLSLRGRSVHHNRVSGLYVLRRYCIGPCTPALVTIRYGKKPTP